MGKAQRLCELRTRDELAAVHERASSLLPEGMSLRQVTSHLMHGTFPEAAFRVYGSPAGNPRFFAIIEQSTYTHPFIHISSPRGDYCEMELLLTLCDFVLTEIAVLRKARRCLVFGERGMVNMMARVLGDKLPEFEPSNLNRPFHFFYMDDESIRKCIEMKLEPPEGFVVDDLDWQRDCEQVDASWENSTTPEATRARLRSLPGTCLSKKDSGRLVSWCMCSPFGQVSNLYTVPEFRGRGLGSFIEALHLQKLCRLGMRPFKYVDPASDAAMRSTARVGFYRRWEREKEGSSQPVVHYFYEFNAD